MPLDSTEPGSDRTRELRIHGRGGQGGVTCAKILASVYARLGKSVQTFGDYAGERAGAPVRAYTRVSDSPITNRNKVYNPDELVVLDPSLLAGDIVSGLRPGGLLLLNSPKPADAFAGQFDEYRLATVDATEISRRHKIGSRSVVIVNTSIAGAYARLMGVSLDLLEETYTALGLSDNFPAAREAYEAVSERPPLKGASGAKKPAAAAAAPVAVEPLPEHRESPPTGLKTGSWSSQRPIYVEKLAPCNAWCPAGNDVVGFIQALERDGADAAALVLARTSPLPGVCGRVCPAPCEHGCNRGEYDGAVRIRLLERWIADHGRAEVKPAACDQPFRVAVIGSGPAGLSAAYTLALLGHKATVFEGEKQLGGILRTGIPAYRLPPAVLDREIDRILALGVEARTGEFISKDRLAALASEFDALILAAGHRAVFGLKVEGANLDGVHQGIDILKRINSGEKVRLSGHVVIVLGGGFTAMDCARNALRAGAERVTVAYRRTEQEIPASRHEIDEALEEGVEFRFQLQPVAFHGTKRVDSIEFAEVEMGALDASGRRQPVLTKRRARIDCDQVILALGQSGDASFLPDRWRLDGERVLVDGQESRVFVAGDLATGEGTVSAAIGSGRRSAGLVLGSLAAKAEVFARPDKNEALNITEIRLECFPRIPPAAEAVEPAASRVSTLAEVNQGLADAREAKRCFSCGHCTKCDTCLVYCPEGIVRRTPKGYAANFSYCKGCGLCVEECPRGAMEMKEL